MGRLLLVAAVCLLLAGPLVLVPVRLLGLDLGHPVPAVLAVFPWVVLLSAVATGAAVLVRWWPGAMAGGVLLLAGLAVLAPRVLGGTQPALGRDAPTLTVAVANLRLGQADADAVVVAMGDHDVDVLVTLELTQDAIDRLAAAGLDELLPNTTLEPSRLTSGGGIHSRLPLTALAPSEDRGVGRTPRATVALDGAGEVEVVGVHPLPPVGRRWTSSWRQTLGGLPSPVGDGRRLLAGDFNATLDHAPFRSLLDDGWRDAAAEVGAGLRPTFNALPYGEPVPPVTLDHVLVDGDTLVEEIDVVPLPDSDHRIVVARLRLSAT